MRSESEKFLEALINSPSPSGFEEPAQHVVFERMRKYCDEVTSDVHGNVIGSINAKAELRVMLAGHVDHIGLMVKHITDAGFLHFASIGGVDLGIVAGQKVLIHSKNGPVPGVIGKKAVHLMTPEDRKKVPELKDLFIDVGVDSRKKAEKLVFLSDPVTFVAPYHRLAGDTVAGGGFDDAVGSFVVVEVMRLLARRRPKVAVFGVSTVQEELGLRGARTSAFDIDPHAGIAIDVTHASDYPGSDKITCGEVTLGKGPVLHRGANMNSVLSEMMVNTAKKRRIPYQFTGEPRSTGTDANVIQINRAGVAATLVSIPNRYMHTPVEVVNLKDLDNAARLITETIRALTERADFRPLVAHRKRTRQTRRARKR